MSVIYCHGCETHVDTDFHPSSIVNDEEFCEDCELDALRDEVNRLTVDASDEAVARGAQKRVVEWTKRTPVAPDGMAVGFAVIYRDAYRTAQHHADIAMCTPTTPQKEK